MNYRFTLLEGFTQEYKGNLGKALIELTRDEREAIAKQILNGEDITHPVKLVEKECREWVVIKDGKYELLALLTAMNYVSYERAFNQR